jgi:transposase
VTELIYLFRFGGLNKQHHVFSVELSPEALPESDNEISQCRWFRPTKVAPLSASVPTRAIVDLFVQIGSHRKDQARRARGHHLTVAGSLQTCIPDLLRTSADELTAFCQTLLTELLQHLTAIEERIHLIDTSIQAFMKHSTLCKKIAAVLGIGPITATAVVGAVGNAMQFRNGRHFAAWLGLVPRQYSSGGKSRLQGINRRGDTYLRTLLIHGARAVLRYVKGKTDPHSVWLQQMIARRGHNCTAVALANKNARIIQALLSGEAGYVSPVTTA